MVIPLEYQNDGHLVNPRQFLYRDCNTPSGKRVIAFISVACLESLDNPEINCSFLDGTFKIKPKYMNQVWILRAFIGDSTIALTYAYFLLESKLAESYTLALSIIKTAAPLFNPPNFMVDFESDGPRGANGAPNCSSNHPDSSHIGFHGSNTNGMAIAAQNAPAVFRRESLK